MNTIHVKQDDYSTDPNQVETVGRVPIVIFFSILSSSLAGTRTCVYVDLDNGNNRRTRGNVILLRMKNFGPVPIQVR